MLRTKEKREREREKKLSISIFCVFLVILYNFNIFSVKKEIYNSNSPFFYINLEIFFKISKKKNEEIK
jgi:hypothetical protein